MNPYDFVRIDWQREVERQAAISHDRFAGVSGRVMGTITTLTPLFIPRKQSGNPQRFITNNTGKHIIPGSSLKGLFRSLVETLGPGCWLLFDGRYRDYTDYTRNLPRDFQQCTYEDSLCVACRLFGLINRSTLRLGNVNFEDAVCTDPAKSKPMYTPILDAPKPRHRAWYLDDQGQNVRGRKFYFHFSEILTSSGIRKSRRGVKLNQYIAPIGTDSVFTFEMQFTNLQQADWQLLLYALVLEDDMRHKIGYAKPAGLGSIHIELTNIELIDYAARYTSPNRGVTVYENDALLDYVQAETAQAKARIAPVTLNDLQRIWHWPPHDVTYGYPRREWFNANPNAPISATRDAPIQ